MIKYGLVPRRYGRSRMMVPSKLYQELVLMLRYVVEFHVFAWTGEDIISLAVGAADRPVIFHSKMNRRDSIETRG